MPHLTDPAVASAIRLLVEESTERRSRLLAELAQADRHHEVVGRLHDLLIEAESKHLRVVPDLGGEVVGVRQRDGSWRCECGATCATDLDLYAHRRGHNTGATA